MTKKNTETPIYLFGEGTNFEAYKFFKIAYVVSEGKKVWRFRVWAPEAKSVSVVGDFNGWNRKKNPMTHIGGGVFEGHAVSLKKYDNYKYSIEQPNGVIKLKADPFALHAETAPGTASKIYELSGFNWTDGKYAEALSKKNPYQSPMNIYELHLGSWKKNEDGSFYSYTKLAETLIPYIKDMGYTHIELLPITEFPYDGSWGYQATGLYAPTSRFGTPHDLMFFINECHKAGIGVLLDFVISHFPKDEHGLVEFCGKPLYEYTDKTKMEHKAWGTRVYDFGRPEVRSFLISAVNFWFETYHIDGVRLDAVASMLYLNYDRRPGEWNKNSEGGIYNLEAVSFLRELNKQVLTRYPHAVMIAEESTAFPMVTMPPDIGGLGFNFKWNMGFMNDILDYMKIDPFFRKGSHDKLTFSITYAFSENYILPFSHDEVVHGKASMRSKMAGNYYNKFDMLKALLTYQFTHPGKKLNFMGYEFGQFIEWDYEKPLDWLLLSYDTHRNLLAFNKFLNRFYTASPELFELDNTYEGFKWLVVDDSVQNVIAYLRQAKSGSKLYTVVNFSDVPRLQYGVGVPEAGVYETVLHTNYKEFGGKVEPFRIESAAEARHGYPQSIKFDLDGNSAVIFKLSPRA